MPMEDNIWEKNDDPYLANAEDEFTRILLEYTSDAIADLMSALGLTLEGELQKSWLRKIQKRLDPSKFRKMLNYAKQAGKAWTVQQLNLIDQILKTKMPDWYEVAEQFMTQVGALAKVRHELQNRDIGLDEVVIKHLPKKLADASTKALVLQVKTQKEPEKIEIPPFSVQETTAISNAVIHCGNKVQEVTERQHADIRQLVIQALKERWTTSKLTQELLKRTGDYQRDWRRVALTEIAFATNDAYLAGCNEGDTVFVPVLAGSCKYCKSLLEGKTFKVLPEPPKELNYDIEMHYVWPGKSNYGRRVSEYVPCVPLHPYCRHRWQRLGLFYKVVDGKVVRKTREELRQEVGV